MSWKIGLLGIRVGEAAVPGPATAMQTQPNDENHNVLETRGGGRARLCEAHSDVPICMLQHTEHVTREEAYCHANEVHISRFTDGGGRGSLRTAHSDVPLSMLLHAAVDVESDEPDMGHECLSESGIEEALSSDSHTALQTQSRCGGRASPKSQSNFPVLQPDVRATEQGALFVPTDHCDNTSDDVRQDPSRTPLGWKFCTMNVTAFYTQHLAIFELGCHVCGLQEMRLAEAGHVWAQEVMRERNWSIVFGQPLEALRSAWEARPGGVAIAAGPGVELQKNSSSQWRLKQARLDVIFSCPQGG